jgi:hypothetical protein
MHQKGEILRLVQRNLSVVLDFNAGKITDEVLADRALNELGGLIRKLDDSEAIAVTLRQHGCGQVGSVVQRNGKSEPLYLRDMTNKLMHGSKFNWAIGSQSVECISPEPDRWQSAKVDLARLKEVVQVIIGL